MARKNQLFQLLRIHFGMRMLEEFFSKMGPNGAKVATRVKNRILEQVYMASEDPNKAIEPFGSGSFEGYDTVPPNEIKKWGRSYKSLKARGEAFANIYTAAKCRFSTLTSQREITPNFLEMRKADCELFCYIVKAGQLPPRDQLEQIGYRHARGLERVRYQYHLGHITKEQYNLALVSSNESKTNKEKRQITASQSPSQSTSPGGKRRRSSSPSGPSSTSGNN